MLLGPLPAVGVERVAIMADGPLATLPFAVLIPPGSEGPLVTSHGVVHLPSPSVLAAVRERGGKAGRVNLLKEGSLAIFVDPVFDEKDDRWTSGGPAASTKEGVASPQDLPLFPDAVTRGPLHRLPGTAEEGEAILGLFPPESVGKKVVLYKDFDATREAFLAPESGQYIMLHVATHGFVHPRHAALSGLAFSRFYADGRARDGFVRLHDLWGVDLAAELVVLSACETALGHELAGEGLLGWVHGFAQAGVPRVVASLWQVNDRATAALMKRFYAGLLERGESPSRALASAQASLWAEASTSAWRHPYFWSGFVLFGDWR
jgi:CHAT domain-containing protein